LLRQSQGKDVIDKLPRKAYAATHTILVWFRSEFIHKALRLEAEDCSESPDDNDQLLTFYVSEDDPSQPQFLSLPTPKYVIINDSLPSVTQLNEWIKEQIDRKKPGWCPAARLFNTFHTLLDIYSNIASDPPSVSVSCAVELPHHNCVANFMLERILEGCPADYESL
jgi:hypothetical protein